MNSTTPKKFMQAHDERLAYVERGEGARTTLEALRALRSARAISLS